MHIAIIGLGLIGGSIGLALNKAGEPALEIVGYVRHPEAASAALNMGVVNRVETSLEGTVEGAEFVIIATPVLTIKGILSQIADYLPRGCIVTDTASTKVQVMKWAEDLLPSSVDFIGGHPMAGKETYGIQTAEAKLFQGCIYCLTPTRKTSPQATGRIASLVEKLGAVPFLIDAQEHDNLVAGISHLPMLLSAALVSATAEDPSWHKMSKLAASGYRDLTRLASGNPEVNTHICVTNQTAILHWIDRLIKELEKYRQLVVSDENGLEEALIKANRARQEWLKNRTQ